MDVVPIRVQVLEWVTLLTPLFQAAREAHRIHKEECKKGFAAHGVKEYKSGQLYGETLEQFWKTTNAVDGLIAGAQATLIHGDLKFLPLVLGYLKVQDRYFRSGYRRARLWRLLKHVPMDEEVLSVVREVILEQVRVGGGEYREAARLIPRVNTPELESELRKLESVQIPVVQGRIRRILHLYCPPKG